MNADTLLNLLVWALLVAAIITILLEYLRDRRN
jgi:hypothetical protein